MVNLIQQNIFVNHVLTDRFVCCMQGYLQIFHVSNYLQIYKQVLQIFNKVITESVLWHSHSLICFHLSLFSSAIGNVWVGRTPVHLNCHCTSTFQSPHIIMGGGSGVRKLVILGTIVSCLFLFVSSLKKRYASNSLCSNPLLPSMLKVVECYML